MTKVQLSKKWRVRGGSENEHRIGWEAGGDGGIH
eukprot:CAMPEP_0198678400 /NCGR_PEP_ID=MMETSP1468-20131203/762_1 /TAXON_ID=1461545 /ORGANISM="Mantoniella sp, Strain CCMP1436" /LENGTH=33 /DNA_ID= /DNA_START= /DNA_END= /DNA_ORIENTATION=